MKLIIFRGPAPVSHVIIYFPIFNTPLCIFEGVEDVIIICRDIKDTTVGTLSQRVTNQLMGVKGLHLQIRDIQHYLERVSSGQLPINHQIIYHLQV